MKDLPQRVRKSMNEPLSMTYTRPSMKLVVLHLRKNVRIVNKKIKSLTRRQEVALIDEATATNE